MCALGNNESKTHTRLYGFVDLIKERMREGKLALYLV